MATIALPNVKFYMGRNYASSFGILTNRYTEVFFTFHGHKFELKDLASATLLEPRVNRVEDTVV